jgi:Bacterial aa3 type cytochrome c oxidase subunit IV
MLEHYQCCGYDSNHTTQARQLSEGNMAEKQDITAATGTYEGFIKMFKWGTAATIIITAVVVLIIAS